MLAFSLLGFVASPDPGETGRAANEAEDDEALLNEVVGASVVYPQEAGELQFNLQPAYAYQRSQHLGTLGYALELGATDWWQFEVGWTAPTIVGGQDVAVEVGVGEIELETQWTWMRIIGAPFSAAVAFEVEIPVSGDERTLAYQPLLIAAVEPPTGRAMFFTNVGAELSAEEHLPVVRAGVIGAFAWLRPYAVFSYEGDEAYIVPGASAILSRHWELVAGAPIGLGRGSAPIGVNLILIYEINPFVRH